jgi:tetratricopeptide (TPR) repeat protein
VTVTIPKYPGYAVHARRGYAVDPPTPSPGRAPVDELDALAAAFDREERDFNNRLRGATDLARTIERLQDEPTRWPANPQRESAFVIELAHAALLSGRAVDREAGRQLLIRHHALVRHPLGPDAFERYWLWAAIAALQARHEPAAAQPLVDRALARFPDEPRFLLARAFLADQRRFRSSRTGPPPEEVLTLYDAAAAHPDAGAEAQLRKAWLLHRLGRDAEALELLDTADDSPEVTLRYLRQVCRGEVLGALERPAEAAAAFRAALALAPEAQSPKVELMTALLRQGDLAGAQRLAAEIETGRGDAVDPAWVYWLGDYRSFADIVRRLREQTR